MIHAILPRNLHGFTPEQEVISALTHDHKDIIAANGASFLPLKHEDDCNFYF